MNLPTTVDRVPRNTSDQVNSRIERQTENRTAAAPARRGEIDTAATVAPEGPKPGINSDCKMAQIICLALERSRRGGPSARETLELRISALMTVLDDHPDAADQIIDLLNEVWLLDADEAELAQPSHDITPGSEGVDRRSGGGPNWTSPPSRNP